MPGQQRPILGWRKIYIQASCKKKKNRRKLPFQNEPLHLPGVKATTEGVVLAPSAFSITLACFPSMTATHEFVVPRSIPITWPETPPDLNLDPPPPMPTSCLEASSWAETAVWRKKEDLGKEASNKINCNRNRFLKAKRSMSQLPLKHGGNSHRPYKIGLER